MYIEKGSFWGNSFYPHWQFARVSRLTLPNFGLQYNQMSQLHQLLWPFLRHDLSKRSNSFHGRNLIISKLKIKHIFSQCNTKINLAPSNKTEMFKSQAHWLLFPSQSAHDWEHWVINFPNLLNIKSYKRLKETKQLDPTIF